jgi:hypothetical protein
VVVNEGGAAEAGRRSRADDSRGARGSLVARIGRGSPCGGNQGVRAARDRPATRELGRPAQLTGGGSSRNPDDAEARGEIAGLGKLPGDKAELLRWLWWSRARQNGGSTVRPRDLARRRKGVAALGFGGR